MRYFLTVLLVAASFSAAHAAGMDEARAGLAAAQRGDSDEAIRRFTAALTAGDLSPSNIVIAHHNRGNSYQDKGDYAQAIAEYTVAIRLKPDYAEAYYARGRARFASGDFATATTDFMQSVKLDPADAYAVLWLYMTRRKIAATDAGELSRNAAKLDLAPWPGSLINLYLGKATPQQVRAASAKGDAKAQREQACEAAFYIGEFELLRANPDAAYALFKDALKICPFTTDEYDGAAVELQHIP